MARRLTPKSLVAPVCCACRCRLTRRAYRLRGVRGEQCTWPRARAKPEPAAMEAVWAQAVEAAHAVNEYAAAFDFKQGELPLSSWRAPAVRRAPPAGAQTGEPWLLARHRPGWRRARGVAAGACVGDTLRVQTRRRAALGPHRAAAGHSCAPRPLGLHFQNADAACDRHAPARAADDGGGVFHLAGGDEAPGGVARQAARRGVEGICARCASRSRDRAGAAKVPLAATVAAGMSARRLRLCRYAAARAGWRGRLGAVC